jgi:hypothetical protein
MRPPGVASTGTAKRPSRRHSTAEQLEAWHVLETLPRPELAPIPAAAAGRPRRHPGHWVCCRQSSGTDDRVVYWNSETRQLSLDAPEEGAHFTESVAEQADFNRMWTAAVRSDFGSGDTSSSDEEPQCFERGQPDRIAEMLAAGAPGGGCSESWGWGTNSTRTAQWPAARGALLQDKRKAARFAALVAQLRSCARQRYLHGLSDDSTAAAASVDRSKAGNDDAGDNDGSEEEPLGEAAAAAVEAVAVDCATMVTSLMNIITTLRSAEAKSSAASSRPATEQAAREENEGHALCRILSAGRLLALPEQVRYSLRGRSYQSQCTSHLWELRCSFVTRWWSEHSVGLEICSSWLRRLVTEVATSTRFLCDVARVRT